jgi:hypothetical protein
VRDPDLVSAFLQALGHDQFTRCSHGADDAGEVAVDRDVQSAEVGRAVGGDVVASQPNGETGALEAQHQSGTVLGCPQRGDFGEAKAVRYPVAGADDTLFVECRDPLGGLDGCGMCDGGCPEAGQQEQPSATGVTRTCE